MGRHGGRGIAVFDRERHVGQGRLDGRVLAETLTQAGVDQLPHPGKCLVAPLCCQFCRIAKRAPIGADGLPHFVDAFIGQRANLEHRRAPIGRTWMQHGQRRAHLPDCQFRRGGVDVALVEDDDVGELDDAFLDGLQVIAGIGQLQQNEHVRHSGNGRL